MIVPMSEQQFIAQLKAFGFTDTGLSDKETGVSVWEYNGKFYTVPLPIDDISGKKYDPLALKIFLKKVRGEKSGEETIDHSNVEYSVSPAS